MPTTPFRNLRQKRTLRKNPGRTHKMRITLLACLLLAASTPSLFAQQPALNETQKLGQALFVQSCGVCHLKPQLTAVQFGPTLSKDSLGGQETAMVQVIANGTPRMPGFKHHFDQTQIA